MLQHNLDLLDTILANINHGVIVFNGHNLIQQVNPAFEILTGYTAEYVIGKDLKSFMSEQHNTTTLPSIMKSLDSGDSWQGEMKIRCQDGNSHPLHLSIHVSHGETEQSNNYVLIIQDINDETVPGKDYKSNTNRDKLTGLPNIYLFKDRLEQGIITAKRTSKSVATLIFRIDRLDIINDGLGHGFGDLLIKDVSTRLRSYFRDNDTVAYIKGNRFAMILQVTTNNDGVVVVEKLLNTMSQPFIVEKREVNVTVSLGISLYPIDGKNVDILIKHAESAMHHAKVKGGNQYMFFANDLNIKAKKRI